MIGIFDSGIGGLTVVRELQKKLPQHQLVYFGDTARTPYGNKSESTIIRYALQDTKFLLDKGAQIIVVACNTASAVAADHLKKEFDGVPIFEVITPAVQKAITTTTNNRIGVIGTRATVHSRVYQEKINLINKKYKIFDKACPLFVPLAEEGWIQKPATKNIARSYLQPLKMKNIDTLILGCTHYPLLKNVIQLKMGRSVTLVDPAEEIAGQLKKYLAQHIDTEKKLAKNNNHQYYFSDLPAHLKELASIWLGTSITPQPYRIA